MPFTLTGSDLRRLRESLGISQAELARAIVVTRYTVCRWEARQGASIPRVHYGAVLDALKRLRDTDAQYNTVAASLLATVHAPHSSAPSLPIPAPAVVVAAGAS